MFVDWAGSQRQQEKVSWGTGQVGNHKSWKSTSLCKCPPDTTFHHFFPLWLRFHAMSSGVYPERSRGAKETPGYSLLVNDDAKSRGCRIRGADSGALAMGWSPRRRPLVRPRP